MYVIAGYLCDALITVLWTLQMVFFPPFFPFFWSTGDVRTSGWVKPASDFVVTFHSNIWIPLGADVSHNTAITTWKPEVREPELWNIAIAPKWEKQSHTAVSAQVNVIVVNQTCGGRRASASDFTHHAPRVTGSCVISHLFARRDVAHGDSPWMKIPIT